MVGARLGQDEASSLGSAQYDAGVLYRAGETQTVRADTEYTICGHDGMWQGQDTFLPRAVMLDFRGNLGAEVHGGFLYGEAPELQHAEASRGHVWCHPVFIACHRSFDTTPL